MRVVTVGAVQPQQLIYAPYPPPGPGGGGTPTVVFNADEINTLFLSNTQEIDAGCVQIPPLGAIPFDGSLDVFGLSINAGNDSIAVYCIEGATSPTPSPVQVQIAIAAAGLATAENQIAQETGIPAGMLASSEGVTTEIAALIATGAADGSPGGVPLLTGGEQLYGVSDQTVDAGDTLTTGTLDIDGIGFEAFLDIYSAATDPAGIEISVVWYLDGTFADQRSYYVFPGTSPADPAVFEWRGPSRGDQCAITITNLGNGTLTVVGFQFNENSRVYACDDFRSTWEVNPPVSTTMAENDIMAGLIAAGSVTVAESSSETLVLPMYAGKCYLSGAIGVAAADLQFIITPAADPNASTAQIVNVTSDTAGQIQPFELFLPFAQCELEVLNLDASASKTPTYTLVAAEY